jgi:putative PIN family toxin of toxin-antitoxin system
MKLHRIVLDTNVIVSSLRSREGASFKLLGLISDPKLRFHLSVALLLEYESAIKRQGVVPALSVKEKDEFLDFLCAAAARQKVHFLWRPFLKDPGDDMVLQLAVAAHAKTIVTFNKADFVGAEKFGIKIMTPQEFLRIFEEEV